MTMLNPAFNKISLIIELLMIMTLYGCVKDSNQNIFTIVTLNVTCPSVDAAIERVDVDNTLDGTFILDLNTRQEYEIPPFYVGTTSVKLKKGVYMISFDGKAVFKDGQRKKIRFSGYNSPVTAISLLNDKETLNLELTVLK